MKPVAPILLVLAVLAPPVSAATWVIHADGSGDAPTIQAGIDSAAAGDTVLVHPGIYKEAIDFLGKDIVVKSQSGPEQTTLDATLLGEPVVAFSGGESLSAVLEGLTLTGGTNGILVIACEPTIRGNNIQGNGPTTIGGGVHLADGGVAGVWSPLIQNNLIHQNEATSVGGGIGMWQRMTPEIVENTITENEAVNGDGGGIFYHGWHDGGVIRSNVIAGNLAGDHGGGIQAGSATSGAVGLEIGWNIIRGNQAKGSEATGNSGGGMNLARTNAWVHHNTIVGNIGDGPTDSYGGGIVVERVGQPVVEKNIIALSQVGGGIWCDAVTSPVIRNNLAWENLPADGVGSCPTWTQSNGNIVANPAFCDPNNGDYSLAQNSPAITHVAGPLGAIPIPGCGPVSVEPSTWGRIRAMYGSGN